MANILELYQIALPPLAGGELHRNIQFCIYFTKFSEFFKYYFLRAA